MALYSNGRENRLRTGTVWVRIPPELRLENYQLFSWLLMPLFNENGFQHMLRTETLLNNVCGWNICENAINFGIQYRDIAQFGLEYSVRGGGAESSNLSIPTKGE